MKTELLFSRVLRDSTPRFVGPSVDPSVGHTLLFQCLWFFLAVLLLPKCFTDLNHGPAHPHATSVAVYPALFCLALDFESNSEIRRIFANQLECEIVLFASFGTYAKVP